MDFCREEEKEIHSTDAKVTRISLFGIKGERRLSISSHNNGRR